MIMESAFSALKSLHGMNSLKFHLVELQWCCEQVIFIFSFLGKKKRHNKKPANNNYKSFRA